MFAFLRGVVAHKGLSHLDLDVNGVGYEVFVPASVLRKVTVEQPVTVLTYCHIREDVFQIFGFLREEDKTLFKMLLGITGIGPKVALAVLSALSVSQFAQAVRDNDVTALTRISGVGKKTGQRIVLEMKAKLGQDAELDAILGEPAEGEGDMSDDVVAALCGLGCTFGEARKLAAKARAFLGAEASDEEVVKAALRSMAKVK